MSTPDTDTDFENDSQPTADSSSSSTEGSSEKSGPTAGQKLAAQMAAKAAQKAAKRGKAPAAEEQADKRATDIAHELGKHARLLNIAAAVAVPIGLGFVASSLFGHRGEVEAGRALTKAVAIANANIRAADQEAPEDEPEGTVTFPTIQARAESALREFQAVTSHHAGTVAASWARLGEAHALLELNRISDARTAFEKARREGGDDPMISARALEGMGFALEAENKPQEAVQKYQELSRLSSGAFRNLADYHLARMYIALHEEVRAKETLRTLVDRLNSAEGPGGELAPASPYVLDQAQIRLAELDPSAVPHARRSAQPSSGGTIMGPNGPIEIGGAEGGAGQNEALQRLIEQLNKQGIHATPGAAPTPNSPMQVPAPRAPAAPAAASPTAPAAAPATAPAAGAP